MVKFKHNSFKFIFILGFIASLCFIATSLFAENQTRWLKDPGIILSELKKNYKLEKDSEGWFWFLGKNYKTTEEVSEEDIVKVPAIIKAEKTKEKIQFRSFATRAYFTQLAVKNEEFTTLRLPGGGSGGEVGKPELPYYGKFIAVPREAETKLVIDNVKIEPIPGKYKIFPVQPPLLAAEDIKKSEFTIDEESYKQDKYINEDKIVHIAEDVIIRGRRFIYVVYQPILYNPARNKLKAAWGVKWSLKYNYKTASSLPSNEKPWESEMVNSIGRMAVDARPELGALPKQAGQGYQVSSGQSGSADYLIIVHDNFYNQILPLAEWKTKKGYKVCITKLTEINSSGSPPATEITNYIRNAYTSWNPAPLYVLLVGDSQFLAPHYIDSVPTDLYYAAIDGADMFPDLFIGRLPCATTQEAETMVNKILLMEKNPPAVSSYYQSVLVAGAYAVDEPSIETCEAIKDYLSYIGWNIQTSYVPVNISGNPRPYWHGLIHPRDSYYDGTQEYLSEPDATLAISNAVNNGVCLVQSLNHGSPYRWVAPNYNVSHIGSLANVNMLPWVNCMNCSTGKFDYFAVIGGVPTFTDCFAEVWLKKIDGGAYAVIAASAESYFGWNDLLAHGIYESIWPDYFPTLGTFPGYLQVVDLNGIPGDSEDQSINYPGNRIDNGTHFGQILNFAKVFMFDYMHNQGVDREMFERFHLFGCPEQEPRLVLPQALSVNCPTSLGINQEANFNVVATVNTQPLANARVSLILATEFYMGITDEQGMVHFQFTPAHLGEMTITVTHRDAFPFESTILIGDTSPLAPTNLVAAAASSSQINLSWQDNSNNEGGFKIIRGTDLSKPFTEIATIGANTTTFNNTGLQPNTKYYYLVYAYNSAGYSAYTNYAIVTTPDTIPVAPTGLTAVALSFTQIKLTWQDNSNNEGGFRIERSLNGSTFVPIANMGANATTYSDGSLQSGTTYYYRVCAYNSAGASTYSNTANATTSYVLNITTISPTTGSTGTYVYIYGQNFGIQNTSSKVTFSGAGGSSTAQILSWNNYYISCKAPPLPQGTYNVRAANSTGQSNAKSFVIPLPAITSISPISGKAGSYLYIYGQNFGTQGALSKVSFQGQGGIVDASLVSWNNYFIQCKVPSLSPGTYTVKVTSSSGQSNTKSYTVYN